MTMIRIGRLLVLALFVFGLYWGVTNGPREIAAGSTLLQKLVGVFQIAYGVTGLAAILALWFRPRWAVLVAAVWATLFTLTALLAAMAWGADLKSAALGAFITAGIGWLVVWIIRQSMPSDESNIDERKTEDPG
jgi:hypothetical protein